MTALGTPLLSLPVLAPLSSVLLPDIILMLNRSPICVAGPLKQKQTERAVSTPVMAVLSHSDRDNLPEQ